MERQREPSRERKSVKPIKGNGREQRTAQTDVNTAVYLALLTKNTIADTLGRTQWSTCVQSIIDVMLHKRLVVF